jgi:GNAT superfamily N-acetyltransferase
MSMAMGPTDTVRIVRWQSAPDPAAHVSGIDAIFFATAARTFDDAPARAAFRERWLGRYLAHDPQHVWLALGPDGKVAGYLVGCLEDPARTPRFADIEYFATFAARTLRYPAHLHINLDERYRGHGLGSRLIAAFAESAARAGASGVHVITGAGMRNVGFYGKNGFAEVARTTWLGREVVMLGRPLLVL